MKIRWKLWFEPWTVTASRCFRKTCWLITALPSSSSSSSSITGTNLSSFVCFFSSKAERASDASRPGPPADARLVWLHQLLQQTNLHLGSSECSAKITALMFYSCRTDQRDRQTPSRFILESDAEAEQEVIDLQGSHSKTSRVTWACWRFGLLLTSLISSATECNAHIHTVKLLQNILENLEFQ